MEEDDEAAAIARAIAMSQEESAPPAQFSDPAFVNQLLEGLPGVDLNDPSIQQMLASLSDPNFASSSSGADAGDGSKKPKKEEEKKP